MKSVPKELKAGYKAALEDDELLSLKDDAAVLESRIAQLLRDLSKTEAPPWGKVVDALFDYEQAKRSLFESAGASKERARRKCKQAFAQLAKLIRQGADAAEAHEKIWTNIHEAMNLKVRTVQAEHRRAVELETLMPGDKVVLLFTAMMELTKNTLHAGIDDRRQANRLMAEIARKVYNILPGPTVIEHEPRQQGKA